MLGGRKCHVTGYTDPSMRSSVRIICLVLIVFLALLAGSAIYNAFRNHVARQNAGVPGRLYNVDGYMMHLYCTGTGAPTIVLSSGLGDDFTIWAKIQPELSKGTRVCSYDRAGWGWSQARPGIQDANAISYQLHRLVEAAGIEKPFVLMGHSISGLYIRSYVAHYPAELSGVVILDGSTPWQGERLPQELRDSDEQQRKDIRHDKLLMLLGWPRIKGECATVPPGFETYSNWIKANACSPFQYDALLNEFNGWNPSNRETDGIRSFGAMPLLIISSDPNLKDENLRNLNPDSARLVQKTWNDMQEELKGFSSDSRRVIAKGSSHYIQIDRPELINQEVSSFIELVRQRRDFPDNHATVIK